jgi:uncharacterized membrane protein YhaH (DUF805 family)
LHVLYAAIHNGTVSGENRAVLTFALLQRSSGDGAAGGLACCGTFFFLIAAVVVINVAMLVWVARDAKARGMDGAAIWMLLVFFTGIFGLLIYLFSRPSGQLVQCNRCGNQRLAAARVCTHCAN